MLLCHDVYFTLKDRSPSAADALVSACRKYLTVQPGIVFFCAGKRDGSAVIGMLTAYAWMQRTANVGPLPKLAAWCLPYLKPAIEAYHYRPLRAKIDQRVSDAVREGDLSGMLSAVDNIEFARAEHEVHVCTTRGDERAVAARRSGREMAAMAAAALSMVAMSAVIMMGGL